MSHQDVVERPERGKPNMITIEYCSEGTPINDFHSNVLEWIKNIAIACKSDKNKTFKIGSFVCIYALGWAICKDDIDCNDIQLKFEDNTYCFDKFGYIINWPDALRNVDMFFIFEKTQMALYKRMGEQKNEKD